MDIQEFVTVYGKRAGRELMDLIHIGEPSRMYTHKKDWWEFAVKHNIIKRTTSTFRVRASVQEERFRYEKDYRGIMRAVRLEVPRLIKIVVCKNGRNQDVLKVRYDIEQLPHIMEELSKP
jgi:hypothetical protein